MLPSCSSSSSDLQWDAGAVLQDVSVPPLAPERVARKFPRVMETNDCSLARSRLRFSEFPTFSADVCNYSVDLSNGGEGHS